MALATQVELAPQVTEEAVSFAVDGGTVRGVLLRAGAAAPRRGLLFLHGWSGGRNGPHNLFTHLARAAAEAGVPSLRFDFRGRGESDGDGTQVTLDHMAADALAAAACLQKATGVTTIIVVAICSGGNVGIGVLDRLSSVDGFFLLSVYPFSDGDSFGRGAHRTWFYLKEYGRKLGRRETWAKLWRGRIDFRSIGKVLFGHYRQPPRQFATERQSLGEKPLCATAAAGGGGLSASKGRWEQAGADSQRSPLRNLAARRVQMCMMYGDADPDFAASYEYFRSFSERHEYGIKFVVVPGANHNFYSQEWKNQIRELLLKFITEAQSSHE